MSLALVFAAALAAALLTFFTGFGLGTLLMPVLAFFVPLPQAVALTAAVHLINNLGVGAMLGRSADRQVSLAFGLPAIAAALLGAYCLARLGDLPPLAQWSGHSLSPLRLIIGTVIFGLGALELGPWMRRAAMPRRWLPVGGFISGFLGGLSGHQGALRSAVLIRLKLEPQAYLATSVVIGIAVDITRLLAYSGGLKGLDWSAHRWLLIAGGAGALIGAFGGKALIHKVTLPGLRVAVGLGLLAFGSGLGLGLV